jgi:hypothetical protein
VCWVSFFFFAGGKKKQNKIPSNLHCPIKKLKPFLFTIYHYRICLLVSLFTLVANIPIDACSLFPIASIACFSRVDACFKETIASIFTLEAEGFSLIPKIRKDFY